MSTTTRPPRDWLLNITLAAFSPLAFLLVAEGLLCETVAAAAVR